MSFLVSLGSARVFVCAQQVLSKRFKIKSFHTCFCCFVLWVAWKFHVFCSRRRDYSNVIMRMLLIKCYGLEKSLSNRNQEGIAVNLTDSISARKYERLALKDGFGQNLMDSRGAARNCKAIILPQLSFLKLHQHTINESTSSLFWNSI